MEQVAYLASYPKSGSTWIRLLFSAYYAKATNINGILGSRGDTVPYAYRQVSPKPLEELILEEWASLAPAAAMHIPYGATERPLLIKTHHAQMNPFGVSSIPVGLCRKAIYMVRDPRDVVLSYSRFMGQSVDDSIKEMGDDGAVLQQPHDVPQFLSSWSQHVASWYENKTITTLVVRYEDLWDNPWVVMRKIIEFLDDKPSKSMIDWAVEHASLGKAIKQEETEGFREGSKHGPFFGKGGSHWREKLSTEQANKITSRHGTVMEMMGYDFSTTLQ